MTILINGYVDFAPSDYLAALADATALIADIRGQRGCRAYVWSADPTTTGRVYVYENWECERDLAAHLSGTFYAAMLNLLGKYQVRAVEILKYRVDLAEPIYDEQGRARADFFTG